MTEEPDVRGETFAFVIQHMEAMVLKQMRLARKENEKNRSGKAAQHTFGANLLRVEIEWLKSMKGKFRD